MLDLRGLMESSLGILNATFHDTNFLKVLQDPTEEFDAVLVELYELDAYAGYVCDDVDLIHCLPTFLTSSFLATYF